MENQYLNQINKNLDVLWYMNDILSRTNKAVISKWTSANFWGFGETLEDKVELTFPRGYNMSLGKGFKKTQRSPERYNGGIIEFKHNGKDIKIYEPERTIVEIIKDAKGIYNDVLLETIKNFFTKIAYDHVKLMKWATIFKIPGIVSQFEAVSSAW